MNEERLKIAVFVDFDNIEIGVKTKLNRRFDVGTVLEAIKERGEVVTKVAYGNWKQAESYSREMAEHAVHMVQRNTTPGGDKNGADINLALDALEMAFIRDHINAFVIVGGDSDFIALVEKLKQYDKKVFVVGGRGFTSIILQKNCHEFIAYENLVGQPPGARKTPGKEAAASRAPVERAMPLVRRALKVLADREVSPQLGLLKSTLLQLDSTFSERDYGTGTFREFMQRLAQAGLVVLKQVERSLLVELKDGDSAAQPPPAPAHAPAAAVQDHREVPPPPVEAAEAMRVVETVFRDARKNARWPMYLRNVKQLLKSADPAFDERRFGFSGIHDLVREAQRTGIFRVERDRQGILRIHRGERLPEGPPEETTVALPAELPPPAEPESESPSALPVMPVPEDLVQAGAAVPGVSVEPAEAPEQPAQKPRRRRTVPPKPSGRRRAAAKPARRRESRPEAADR